MMRGADPSVQVEPLDVVRTPAAISPFLNTTVHGKPLVYLEPTPPPARSQSPSWTRWPGTTPREMAKTSTAVFTI